MGHYESDLELFLFNSLIKQFAFNLENYMAFSFDHLARSNSIAVMGILNLSPDSFYSTNRFSNADDVLHIAEKMIDQGGGPWTYPILNQLVPLLCRVYESHRLSDKFEADPSINSEPFEAIVALFVEFILLIV